MEKLTSRQTFILQAIKKLVAKKGYPPTVREIGEETNLSSPATIHFHLKKLEEKGYIKKGGNKNRTLEILVPNEYIQEKENVVDVPLLGKVTAGTPIEAIETPDEYFSLPANLITTKSDVFTLRVSGESMINVGIYDEATVKTFYKENGYFRLQPENDTMEPIILKECTILGKVIGLYRKL